MNLFPAILIGGPPHSGKSVLVYNLTRALRAKRVPHYVLRACPDGEGDWANEADQAVVQTIRNKGKFNARFMARVASYLQKRHLPLLVDVGGLPTSEQESVFSLCTDAILLIADRPDDAAAYVEGTAVWHAIAERQHLSVIAHLKSVLNGRDELLTTTPSVTGTITDLERSAVSTGAVFDALVEKVTRRFTYSEEALTRAHLEQSPVELTLDLPELARTLGMDDGYWRPDQLPALLDYLPEQTPLAIYGRAPNWIYAALSLHALPAPVWLFDARLGWIEPPELPIIAEENRGGMQHGWHPIMEEYPEHLILDMNTQSQYLDRQTPKRLPLPALPHKNGLILSGKIPNWLLTAAARQAAHAYLWLAVYQPQSNGYIVVADTDSEMIGKVLPRPIKT